MQFGLFSFCLSISTRATEISNLQSQHLSTIFNKNTEKLSNTFNRSAISAERPTITNTRIPVTLCSLPMHTHTVSIMLPANSAHERFHDDALYKFTLHYITLQTHIAINVLSVSCRSQWSSGNMPLHSVWDICLPAYHIYSCISRPAYKPIPIPAAENLAKISDSRITR